MARRCGRSRVMISEWQAPFSEQPCRCRTGCCSAGRFSVHRSGYSHRATPPRNNFTWVGKASWHLLLLYLMTGSWADGYPANPIDNRLDMRVLYCMRVLRRNAAEPLFRSGRPPPANPKPCLCIREIRGYSRGPAGGPAAAQCSAWLRHCSCTAIYNNNNTTYL